MEKWRSYKGIKISEKPVQKLKEKYSATADIVSFQICPRQYGFFKIRKYQPAHIVQIWYGTVIHQVLDKLHMHYKGLLDPSTEGSIPTDQDVERYFLEVENSLLASKGIRAITENVRNSALKVLQRFNRLEGPTLYPLVEDTECEFQSDRGSYILSGRVDVLRDISTMGKVPKGYDAKEIWDYKGTHYPDTSTKSGREKLKRYRFQMLVYAELYKEKYGLYPLKGVIYFMNELLDASSEPTVRPPQAVYEIDFRDPRNLDDIEEAMELFDKTVEEIEDKKRKDVWEPPKIPPDKETCDICDLRWSCPLMKSKYRMRYP
ncbi:conserved hypothetical protein [Methanocaldococcus sp. FS406-22]|uniref:PD-(D/E)XK nuclease family protein n=1 Tax=Methanocaldococcus sp. (strain FS406-22) TaxID=644281 RepID=UPI0001BF1757|nr:PD-(D/E)XK nuclease family protein [Methanocaldococcus sp. FS406-22]ADC69069.1 conserved hypothetical protein [Methanocaldococcus sp. FS406-22]